MLGSTFRSARGRERTEFLPEALWAEVVEGGVGDLARRHSARRWARWSGKESGANVWRGQNLGPLIVARCPLTLEFVVDYLL
jgi:hypothetical protein